MIFAVRGAVPVSLDGAGSVGGKERQEAIDFYADPANHEESFDFKAYKGADILTALEAMFGQKCAYCESDFGAVAPTDIEHYRPKGAVVGPGGKPRKPGYYWLAAEWRNLLPSCIDCNRARKHDYEDGRETSGKANYFPLADEEKRATVPGGEAEEEPLLLDPTFDDPKDHLEFIGEGAVRPSARDGAESMRGRTTIDVLGLSRPKLVRSRRDRELWIEDAIADVEEAAARLGEDPDDDFAKRVFARAAEGLARHIASSSPYAAMARQRIEPVLAKLGISPPD
jgi:uncharacterized protein (TIGR02646 family)